MPKGIQIELSAGAFLLPAIYLMFLPIQWVFAIVFAGAIHEFCHIAMIYLLNGEVYRMRIGARGAVIETEELPAWKELLCALAGPIGSAMLLLIARWFPRLAVCGAVHCIYNLLPLFPLDGGRVLRSIIYLLIRPQWSNGVWRYSQIVVRVMIAAAAVFLAVKFGWLILLCAILLLKGYREEKPLANRPFWRYNKGNIGKGVQI